MPKPHKLLEVMNVGQGDCMVLRPRKPCCLHGTAYMIDTGDGKEDISKYLDDADTSVSLILTHSHMDHIGGLFHLFPMADRIREIILPFYHDEIILLAKALENLLGIEKVSADSWPIQSIDDYQKSSSMIKTLISCKPDAPSIVFGYEGLRLCGHFICLNPPVETEENKTSYRAQIQKYAGLFSEPFASQLGYWLTERLEHGYPSDTPWIDRDFLYTRDQDNTPGMLRAKALFVLSFLEKNYQRMLAFTKHPAAAKLSPIVKSLNLTANQASLVFRFVDRGYLQTSILFTGDIDVSVFERIVDHGYSIHAEILKIPHHGSKTGLNDEILNAISPERAIISHNNRRFGRAKDPHPNIGILNLLQSNAVTIYVTNEVIKNGKTVLQKKNLKHPVFDVF